MDSVVFGMYGDADIGSTNGDYTDDDAWFDVENDIGETTDLKDKYPNIAQ